jgi:hypothetical protein
MRMGESDVRAPKATELVAKVTEWADFALDRVTRVNTPASPARFGSFETGPQPAASSPPQDEWIRETPIRSS